MDVSGSSRSSATETRTDPVRDTSADAPTKDEAVETTPDVDVAPPPEAPRATPEEVRRSRTELEEQRRVEVQGSFRRAQIDAAIPSESTDVDLLSGDPVVAGAAAPSAVEALAAPVELAEGEDADFARVDAYADELANVVPNPSYYQREYVGGVADALSGRVEGFEGLTDAERTRLLDHAHERFYAVGEQNGDAYVGELLQRSDPDAAQFVAADLADRAMTLSDRARAAREDPAAVPADIDRVVGRSQSYATQAGLANAADPAAFLERLGPDAGRFADALQVDRPGFTTSETNRVVAQTYYDAAADASPAVRDAFRTTLAARATGQPENPIAAEQWRRLSTLDPSSLGQADLRYADELLRDHPPIDRGAGILGEDHPAVVASAALSENREVLRERLRQENAVYERAGFADDVAFSGETPEERAAYLEGVAGRIDTLSPRAADQALTALEQQRAAGIDVPGGAELERDLGRRMMVATGVDLAARLDEQMDAALADRGLVGEGWDGVRNALGLESGSEAVGEQLDRLRAARDELVALESFEGSDSALSVALAERLDRLQGVAQETSEAVSGFIEQQDSLSTRGLGLLQAVGGGLEVVGGAGLIAAPEPLTSVAGVGVVAVGVDDVQAGVRRVVTGEDVPTFRAQLAQEAALAAGASPELAEGIGIAADLAPAGVSLARGVYRQAHRVFAAGRGAAGLADEVPLVDNFTDFMARPQRSAVNAVRGTPFRGAVADDAVASLEAQGIRVVRGADTRLDDMAGAGPGRGPLGGFNHETGELLLRNDPTYYEWFHESAHAQQWLELGRDGYRAQSPLQREAHVFQQIRANAGQFNRLEVRHAENYLQRLADREAHSLMASGRYGSSREVLDILRDQGVPDDILSRIPRETFGYRPRWRAPQ